MPDPAKTKTIGMNMPIEEATEIEASARSMGISTASYCKMVVRLFRDSGQKLSIRED